MEKTAKIYVAGGDTLIGAAIVRQLEQQGYHNLVGRQGKEPNLINRGSVADFFAEYTPDYVFVAAGQSGGIKANQNYPADLMLNNLLVSTHIIEQAHHHQVKKLLYLASSCSYPKYCPQPMQVNSLGTGLLEPTNEAYATAKLAGLKLCQAYRQQYGHEFITAIPANAFGVGDDFSLEDSHVIPALIHRLHLAKEKQTEQVEIWGTGQPRREFIFADDLADACIFVMKHYNSYQPINLGGGEDLSIRELAEIIRSVVGYTGELYFDPTKPDGMPLKALDATALKQMGWQPQTAIKTALEATYQYFLQSYREVAYA